MPVPICASCPKPMVCDKTGLTVLFISDGYPYQIWQTDRFRCDGCGSMVVTGFGNKPIADIYQDNFDSYMDEVGMTVEV